MKIKITRADGTVIEAEGTAEECERIAESEVPHVRDTPMQASPGPVWIAPYAWPFPQWYQWPYGAVGGAVTITQADVPATTGTVLVNSPALRTSAEVGASIYSGISGGGAS